MNPERVDNELVADIEKELRYIGELIKQKGRELLSNYTVTPPQFVALLSLFEDGDMTIGELSTKLFLACSTTTDLVDRMAKNNLVVRIKDAKDRRVVRIHLLDEGVRVLSEVLKKRQNYLAEVLESFSLEEVHNLQASLAKLHQEMQEK